jgi:hypothetical protein
MPNTMILQVLVWEKELESRQQIDLERQNGNLPLVPSDRPEWIRTNWLSRISHKPSMNHKQAAREKTSSSYIPTTKATHSCSCA